MIEIKIAFHRYELKEFVYNEYEGAMEGNLGLENFEEIYYYRVLEASGDIQEMDFITEIGKEEDPMSVSYIRIVIRLYFQIIEEEESRDICKDKLKLLLNLYIFPRLKTMISSITDQSTKLMPYFIKPILDLERLD